MNLDTEIRRAIERLNRSIGQKARYAHADLRRMAEEARWPFTDEGHRVISLLKAKARS